MYFLKRLAFPLDLRQYTDADITTFMLHGLGAVFRAHGDVEQITFHPPTALELVHDALLHQHRTVEIRGHSLVLSAGNELSEAGKGIWRNMSITCEFDVDGVVRDVGDDAVEEELVVAAELLLDGGCREGKLRNRAKDGVVLEDVLVGDALRRGHRPRLAISRLELLHHPSIQPRRVRTTNRLEHCTEHHALELITWCE